MNDEVIYVVEWEDGATATVLTAAELAEQVTDDSDRNNILRAVAWFRTSDGMWEAA